jgi:hypothetical protein
MSETQRGVGGDIGAEKKESGFYDPLVDEMRAYYMY